MPEDVFSLFDDFAARFARGERPEPRAYLIRVGASADELAQLIDVFSRARHRRRRARTRSR